MPEGISCRFWSMPPVSAAFLAQPLSSNGIAWLSLRKRQANKPSLINCIQLCQKMASWNALANKCASPASSYIHSATMPLKGTHSWTPFVRIAGFRLEGSLSNAARTAAAMASARLIAWPGARESNERGDPGKSRLEHGRPLQVVLCKKFILLPMDATRLPAPRC